MLDRHLYLGLGFLLLTNGASAAEETDTRNPKPCGGYYACIELHPSQPDPVFSLTDPRSAQP